MPSSCSEAPSKRSRRRSLSVPEEKRRACIELRQSGASWSKIATDLGIARSTVRCIVLRYDQTGSTEDKKRSGRPSATKPEEDELIASLAMSHKTHSRNHLMALLKEKGVQISIATLQRRLRNYHQKESPHEGETNSSEHVPLLEESNEAASGDTELPLHLSQDLFSPSDTTEHVTV